MKICIVTGSRAEFYILKNLIKKIQNIKYFKNHLIVTGSHTSKFFGNTIKKIKDEKIKIGTEIKNFIKKDNEIDISNYFASNVKSISKALFKIKPDILLILGDRYEIFSAAVAASFNRIPIAHVHGGERSEGALDEAIRHSITKMAHVHFVSNIEHYERVKQMGENKKLIFNVGSMGVESIKQIKFLKKKILEKKLNIKLSKKNILITVHPETLETKNENKKKIRILLQSLKLLKDTTKIFTMPGADPNFKLVTNEIKKFVKKNPQSFFFKSLGDKLYFSLCKNVDLMLGNSSSGIIEMPSFKKATINVGARQKGRLKAKSVLNVDFDVKKINKAIKHVYSKEFKKSLEIVNNPYDNGASSEKILKVLKKIKLKNILIKKFHDNKNFL